MRAKITIWCVWLCVVAAATARYWRWEIEYFRSPGPAFYKAVLVLLPLCLMLCGAYVWIRGRRARNWEAPAVALGCVALVAFYQPLALSVGVLLFLACASAGLRIARLFGIGLEAGKDSFVLGFGFGSTALILVFFVLGSLRALFPWVVAAVLLLAVALFRHEAVQVCRTVVDAVRAPAVWPGYEGPIAGIAVVFAAIAAVCTIAVAVTPSVAYDPLAAHLALAKYYAAEHALTPLPSTNYSYYPQGGEILMAAAWVLGGQPAAQIVSPVFWILLVVLLYAIAREWGLDHVAAASGVVCAAAMPFAHWAGSNAKNDAQMYFFQAAALYAFLRWMREGKSGWIAAGALFLGSTFAVKHTALYGAVPLGCLLGYALLRSRARARMWILCGVLFAAAGLYWHLRTFILTGSPVFPSAAAESVSVGIVSPGNSAAQRLARYAEVAWQTHFGGQAVFESPLVNPAGIALIVFLPLAFLMARRRDPVRRACLFFSTVYLTYWLATSGVLRYAMLPFCLLTMLLVGRMKEFYDRVNARAVRASLLCAFAGALLFSVLGTAIIEINGPMLMLLAKRIDETAYLRSTLTTYGSVEWLNANRVAENVLTVENGSRAYALHPGRFYSFHLNDPNAARRLTEGTYRFAVLPEGAQAEEARQRFLQRREAALVYRDPHFAIYRVQDERAIRLR